MAPRIDPSKIPEGPGYIVAVVMLQVIPVINEFEGRIAALEQKLAGLEPGETPAPAAPVRKPRTTRQRRTSKEN